MCSLLSIGKTYKSKSTPARICESTASQMVRAHFLFDSHLTHTWLATAASRAQARDHYGPGPKIGLGPTPGPGPPKMPKTKQTWQSFRKNFKDQTFAKLSKPIQNSSRRLREPKNRKWANKDPKTSERNKYPMYPCRFHSIPTAAQVCTPRLPVTGYSYSSQHIAVDSPRIPVDSCLLFSFSL